MNYFDTRTGRLLARPQPSGPGPLGPPPIRSRRYPRGFRGFGDVEPAITGAAGPLIAPYSETSVFNPTGGGGAGSVAASIAPTPNPDQTGFLPGSTPFGESDRPWTNPTTFASVPINAATNISVPVLAQNYQRNALIIQNGSTATTPDVAPTLYMNFNAQPVIGFALALPPGVGVVFDIICPRDAIYVAFGPSSNGGGTVVIQGCVVGGTYAP